MARERHEPTDGHAAVRLASPPCSSHGYSPNPGTRHFRASYHNNDTMQGLVEEKRRNQKQINLATVYSRTLMMIPSRTIRTSPLKAIAGPLLVAGMLHTSASGMPDAGDTVSAWYAARSWVDATTTGSEEAGANATGIEGAAACCVILRFDGRLVGIGTAEGDAGSMVRMATAQALEDALDDPTIAALPEDLQGSAGKRLTLELEVAGVLEPLIGNSLVDFKSDIHPLRHGLALRWGNKWSYRYPSRLRLVNNWAEASTLESMGLGLGLTPRAAVEGMQRGDVGAYRFEVLGLAQAGSSHPPMEVVAGSIGVRDIPDLQSLADARVALLDHVIGTLWPGEEPIGVMGVYEPASDRYKPLIASNLDQALTAYALARAANDRQLDPARNDQAARVAATLLGILAESDSTGKSSSEHASFLLALSAMPDLEETDAIARHKDDAISHFQELQQGVSAGTIPDDSHGLGMASLAMARTGNHRDARLLADKAWETLPPERHVSLMPWIAWTELELAGGGTPAHAKELVEIRTLLHERQVPSGDDQFGPELAGGFVFGQNPDDVHSQSLRPAAAMASMMLSPHLTAPGERMEMMNRLNALAGFLLRLQMSSEGAALIRHPERGAGGIRMAFWDNRMPPAAQVMALLTLEELLSMEDAQTMYPEDDHELY